MALSSDDYLDIVNAVIDCIHLKEQQESIRLIKEKLDQLNRAIFESQVKEQKALALIIARLKFLEKRLRNKATIVDPILKETWELLASNVGNQLFEIIKQKRNHARLL
ncbi:hypothetical protein [Flavobacterium sp. CAN_S2]|jgi:hypothetical protein|uniref:hypothetical protein n=1 Tax=Flavobacterium sp. CAN_S2 TaxID=2787726 RepID=UPI0018C9FE20